MGPTDPSGTYRREPEVAPSSGGHLAPDTAPTPRADPLGGSLSARALGDEGDPRRSPSTGARRAPRRRLVRRVRRTLRHIDPVSVFKLSLFYYGCFFIVWLLFVAGMYAVASALGVFDLAREVSTVFFEKWTVTLWTVEKWAFMLGIVFWVLGAILNAILAFIYNVAADFVGGVEMTFVERDTVDKS